MVGHLSFRRRREGTRPTAEGQELTPAGGRTGRAGRGRRVVGLFCGGWKGAHRMCSISFMKEEMIRSFAEGG